MALTRLGGAVKSDRIFNTVADMVASKTVKVGDIVEVAGYTTVNDGGHGKYEIVAAATGTDDGGSFIDLDSLQAKAIFDGGTVNPRAFGCVMDGVTDDTDAFSSVLSYGLPISLGDGVLLLKPDTSGELTIPADTIIFGNGKDSSKILVSETANPASSKYALKATAVDNLTFRDFTLECDAATQGIFNLGSLDANGVYSPDQTGAINGIRIESCDNVTFDSVLVKGFNGAGGVVTFNTSSTNNYCNNFKMINCDSKDNRETGFNLLGLNGFEITGGLHENNGLQVFDSVDANGNPTSSTRTTTNYIDGGVGYGIIVGRVTTATNLKSKNGIVHGVRTKRNVRYGIDIHSGVNITVSNCKSEDDLIGGQVCLDNGASYDTDVGYIIFKNNEVIHTDYAENRGPLFDARSVGDERDDSQPCFITNTNSHINEGIIEGLTVRDYRFRQITGNYSTDDTIQFCSIFSSRIAKIKNCNFVATDADWYPAKVLKMQSPRCILEDNEIEYGTRGDFDVAAIFLNSTSLDSVFKGNIIKVRNNYSTGTTDVARAILDRGQGTDLPYFVGNIVEEPSQGLRKGLWNTGSTNARLGYNGFLSVNEGNLLNGEEYASRINRSETFYFSVTGGGRYDGSSSGNALRADNMTELQAAIDQLPEPGDNHTVSIQFADGAYTLSGTLTIPFDRYELLGNSGEFGSATTKSVDWDNSAACNVKIVFDRYWNKCVVKGMQIISASGKAIDNPTRIEGCVIENSGTAANVDYGIYRQGGAAFYSDNYFTGGYAAIGGFEGAAIVSRVNQSTGTNPTYGLQVNGGIVMKNSTQPTGATANELSANGGVIR